MKNIYLLIFTGLLCASSCKSDQAVEQNLQLPEFWYSGCANFQETEFGYVHEGRCCEKILFPKIDLKRNQTFSVIGNYSMYTQSGLNSIQNQPVNVTGFLSADGNRLEINYELNAEKMSYVMQSGDYLPLCDCQCYFK